MLKKLGQCCSLDVDAAHALVRALIHSRLDYCNGVLAGLPLYMFKRLQSVLNAAARLVLVLPGRQSVSIPMRNKLHWLGFPQRVMYKLCVLSYKCLHGLAPEYLSRWCIRIIDIPGHAVRISGQRRQVSLWCRLRTEKHLVTKAFSTQAPLPGTIFPVSCTTMLQCLL